MSTPFALPGVTVPLRSIELELNRQTNALQGDGVQPVRSARMSNLVVFCDDGEQAQNLASEIRGVVAVHPARVLLVVGEDGEPSEVTSSALVRVCQTRADHACSELVTLHATGATVARLPFAVRALLVGDLPINLWWATPQPPPLAGAFLFDLAENAQQIIYDSRGWVDPTRAVAATASWLQGITQQLRGGRRRVASDLNWRRLKYWRRLLTQTLEATATPGATATATELLIEHGPHAVIQAWELASWVSRHLGWKVEAGKVEPGVEIGWQFRAAHGMVAVRIRRLPEGPSEVRQIRLRCHLEGQPATLVFRPSDATHLEAAVEGTSAVPRTITVQPFAMAELVGRQLSDREPDAVFTESMAVAQTLAQSLLK